jgi:hypothetical protein
LRPTAHRQATPTSPSTPVRAELYGQTVLIISVAKWEALKPATGRAKDLEHPDRFYESQRDH